MIEATVEYKRGGVKVIVAESFEALFRALENEQDKYVVVTAKSRGGS